MSNKVIFKTTGIIEYEDAWSYQQKLLSQIQEFKKLNFELPVCEQIENYNFLLFCEHPHVYTLGKSGKENNLLVDENFLKSKGATFYRIDRGGDITYHGPGQITGYPIIDLEAFGLSVRQYIYQMEEAIIQTLQSYSIDSTRLKGATGVWLDVDKAGKTRKICAIGVKVSRAVSMHGFAFNVNTDLDFYRYINPCGFIDKGVTSMEQELGRKVEMAEVMERLKENFREIFNFDYVEHE